MTPMARYQHDLERNNFQPDAAQARAVALLQDLYERLLRREQRERRLVSRLRYWLSGSRPPERGLYFWGGVGRGKTYLVDTFFESLPIERKLRVHFHRFMQRVHERLTALDGEKNPLQIVAEEFARDALVICFDEFFVSDIADAMILAGLMSALFDRGVTLVATSNIEPENLYKDGLQRARFLPAIALLETHTQVVNVDAGVDYRLRTLTQAALYQHPNDAAGEAMLAERFAALTHQAAAASTEIEINHRQVRLERVSEGVAWFAFDTLCRQPRSPSDFIELARVFHTVLLADVPIMKGGDEDVVRRFINLIDEFYDRNVKLIITAEGPADALYSGSLLAFEFQRTLSRLQEMQSHEYLAREHRP
ncbi:MAG: cell division protein ZapE [Halieaceae bacterium]|jgi:cell division protein ZapE|nr:cell division protein ZapE [Halieaceae bacterium]